jgi:NADP-dependent aldehyde dehydrogenase
VGFTGSLHGGRALYDMAASRPDPIPFYGELGSINPLVITPAAAAERLAGIATGLVASFTQGNGQYCTKPGLVFAPMDKLDELGGEVAAALAASQPGWFLTDGIRGSYESRLAELGAHAGVSRVAVRPGPERGFSAPAEVLATTARTLTPALVQECFGPMTLLVGYDRPAELAGALELIEGSLTATLHVGSDADPVADEVAALLAPKAGRLVWNAFPTALPIGWATHHGGPWPASVPALHTSVGATAIRRFLRPFAWQDAPARTLPEELRDGGPVVPRREDGRLVLPV